MNDGMYTNIRNYLEEIASQNRQILAELKRGNELAAGKTATPAKPAAKKPATPATVEKQLEAETGRDFAKTGDNPPTWAETDKPAVPGALRARPDAPVEGLAAMGTMTEPSTRGDPKRK